MSIRARLTVITVLLLAVALGGCGAITYSLLHRSLIDRMDAQLAAAVQPATTVLQMPDRVGTAPTSAQVPADSVLIPAGTFAEILGPDGASRAQRFFGPQLSSPPVIPRTVPGSTARPALGPPEVFDADAEGGSGIRYRVLAAALPAAAGTAIVAVPRTDADEILRRLLILEVLVGLAVVLTAGLCTRWTVAFGLRPVRTMARAADGITAGNLTDRVRPSDARSELGRLGLALNSMLGRIDDAFAERKATEDRLRRFVADASHELRSPVTSIRGYAELFQLGGSLRLDDLAYSMERIEAEAARMGGLVEELLLLARLDEGVPLQRGPVDLAAVAGDAIADLRVGGRHNPVSLVAGGPVVVDGDEARLRQVVANLLTNAVTHTPEGTPVHVSVLREGDEVVLCVADEGPGLAPEVAARAFDRFFRDPRARSERKGAGLGLSIVSAIVDAHGGKVGLEPGPGARFVCRMPSPRAEGPRPEGPKADGHKADGHKADGHRGDGHKAAGRKPAAQQPEPADAAVSKADPADLPSGSRVGPGR